MNNHAPTTDDIVEQAVAALRATALDDRPPAALIGRTVAALDKAGQAPRPWLATRLGRPFAAIAAAAALATAAAVMLAVGLPGVSGSGSAFAAMLDKVREMKSVRYRVTVSGVEQTAGTAKAPSFVTIETAEGARLEMGSLVSVFRHDGVLMLDTNSKTATTFSNDEAKDRQRQRPDLLGRFRQADGSWGEPIEGKQVGNVAARGYRVTKRLIGENDPEWVSMRVYVDPATELPVRVEQEVRLSDDDKSERLASVLSDFEWDIEVDPVLLSLDPPAGYRHEQSDREPVSSASPAEAIAAGLRFYADHLQGSLPSGIDGFEPMIALQGAVLDDAAKKEILALDMGAKMKFIRQRFAPWFGLLQAPEDFEKQNIKVHYLGKGLEAGDGSKIVAWWKAEKPGRAIAVRDDFSWKEIDEPAATP
jgi:hypothetical protein